MEHAAASRPVRVAGRHAPWGTVSSTAFHTAWYRTVKCWRRQRASYLVLVLLVGLVGGVALGSLAAARRTASSFSTFLAASNPSNLLIEPAGGAGHRSTPPGAEARRPRCARYPEVTRVESYMVLNASLVRAGRAETRSFNSNVVLVGSVNGLLFNQDRFAVTSGRMADPARADEVMVTQNAAATMGLHLGQIVPVELSSASGSGPVRRIGLKIVGIGLLNREVVQDEIGKFPTYIVATPALTAIGARRRQQHLPGRAAARRLGRRRGRGAAVEFERALLHRLPGGVAARDRSPTVDTARGTRARRRSAPSPALAALFLGIQVIARRLGAREQDLVGDARSSGPTPPRPCSTASSASSARSWRGRSSPSAWRSPCPASSPSGPSVPSTPTPA